MFHRPGANQSSLANLEAFNVPDQVIAVQLDAFEETVESWKNLFSDGGMLAPYDDAHATIGGIAFDMKARRRRHLQQRKAGE